VTAKSKGTYRSRGRTGFLFEVELVNSLKLRKGEWERKEVLGVEFFQACFDQEYLK